MSQLSNDHLKSIDRVLLILQSHHDRQSVPKYRRVFRKDIANMLRIRKFTAELVYSPIFDDLDDAPCELVT